MKKLLAIIVLGLLWSNVVVAKPIYLNCKDNEKLITGGWMHEFISLDFDNKKYLWEGKSIVKGNDISKGKIIIKETIELPPLAKEDSDVLIFARSFIANDLPQIEMYEFDKKNFDLLHAYNGPDGAIIEVNLTCTKIDKFPF